MEISYLCNLPELAGEIEGDTKSVEDYLLKSIIPAASYGVADELSEEFEPVLATRTVWPSPAHMTHNGRVVEIVDADSLRPMRIMELQTMTIGGKDQTIDTDVTLYHQAPTRKIQLLKGTAHELFYSSSAHAFSSAFFGWPNTYGDGNLTRLSVPVDIKAWWGFRSGGLTKGWKKITKLSGDIDDAINDIILTASVDPEGPSAITYAKLSPGGLIKVDDELMRITSYGDDPTGIVCERGVNGTDPDTHDDQTDIYVWIVEPIITRATQRWGAQLFAQKDLFWTETETSIRGVTEPGDMPNDVRRILERFAR